MFSNQRITKEKTEPEVIQVFINNAYTLQNLQNLPSNHITPEQKLFISGLKVANSFNELDKLFDRYITKNSPTSHQLTNLFKKELSNFTYFVYQLWIDYDAYKTQYTNNTSPSINC